MEFIKELKSKHKLELHILKKELADCQKQCADFSRHRQIHRIKLQTSLEEKKALEEGQKINEKTH